MSIPRTGAMLPNGNFNPKQFSTYMQAIYHATHVVPMISNRDYEGDINKKGDTVYIRRKPGVQVFDYTIGQDLEKQTALADDLIPLTIDYASYFNIPLNDLDLFLSDIDVQQAVAEEGGFAIGDKIEQRVLQTIWSSAGSTIPTFAMSKATAIMAFAQMRMMFRQKNVPDSNNWAVIDPITAYCLGLSDLSRADVMGGAHADLLKSGKPVDKIQGFDIYISNNTQASASTSKILCGHMDALAFASKFQKSETVRDPKDFVDLIRSIVAYGFKVTKTEALGCIDVTSFTLT